LSRFHKDVGILEDRLPYTFLNFSKCCAWCFVVFILAITADIPVIAAAVPFSAVFVWLYRYSKPCNRCLAHIEAKSRRQIGRHLVELMHGAVAIRAAKQEAFIRAAGFKVLDANTRANFALLAQTHWLG
jgi:ATP-binding cassette subfamily C (CFTR/MRP) protein 4